MATNSKKLDGAKSGISPKSMLRLKILEMVKGRSFAPLASQKSKVSTKTDKPNTLKPEKDNKNGKR